MLNIKIDFISIFFYTMHVNRDQKLFGYQYSSKYLRVEQKRETHIGLEQLEGK